MTGLLTLASQSEDYTDYLPEKKRNNPIASFFHFFGLFVGVSVWGNGRGECKSKIRDPEPHLLFELFHHIFMNAITEILYSPPPG